MRAIMSVSGRALLGIMVVVAGVAIAWPAHADPDTDFANELHTYGVYGPKDYTAWIGKITCKRFYNGLDQDADKPLHARLSEREFQVLCKLAAGRAVSDIAGELCLSVKTVSTYRTRVLDKMHLETNADLTTYALRNGLIQ